MLELQHPDESPGGSEIDSLARSTAMAFAASLPHTRHLLDSDVTAAYHGDPAAHSVDEVLLCYPGVLAMVNHRIAHTLYRLKLPLLARIVAELAHSETGVDIHPGASIGPSFFIDHGTGVVIGETAIIGARVRLYQAVTLGAKRFPTDSEGNLQKGLPRPHHDRARRRHRRQRLADRRRAARRQHHAGGSAQQARSVVMHLRRQGPRSGGVSPGRRPCIVKP